VIIKRLHNKRQLVLPFVSLCLIPILMKIPLQVVAQTSISVSINHNKTQQTDSLSLICIYRLSQTTWQST